MRSAWLVLGVVLATGCGEGTFADPRLAVTLVEGETDRPVAGLVVVSQDDGPPVTIDVPADGRVVRLDPGIYAAVAFSSSDAHCPLPYGVSLQSGGTTELVVRCPEPPAP